ncbi:hypothetical protein, partial [Shewanella sp.]|uniref:hypothetical protein n=1 Tax=Shewanella sp. TaxID=50422 RepID=UPI00356583F9
SESKAWQIQYLLISIMAKLTAIIHSNNHHYLTQSIGDLNRVIIWISWRALWRIGITQYP